MAPAAPLPRLITSIPPGPRQNKRTLLVARAPWWPSPGSGALLLKFGGQRPALSREPRDRPVAETVITESRTHPARGLAPALDLCAAGPPARAGPGPHADVDAGADAQASGPWPINRRATAMPSRRGPSPCRPSTPETKREDVQEDRGCAAAAGAARARGAEGGAETLVLQGDPDAGRRTHPAVPRGEGRRGTAGGRARSFPRPSGRRPPTRRRSCMPIKWCRGCSCNPSIVTSRAPCG